MTATGHEEEFRRLFEEEALQRLSGLAEHALELEERGIDAETVASMFRHAHTLKGGAGVVGFRELADVLHDLESLIDDLREGRRAAGHAVAEAILGTVDALREMVACAMAGADQAPAADAARAAMARADATPEATQAATEPEPEATALPAAPEPAAPPASPVPAGRAGERDAIPVPVARLDDLVRLVGEGAAAQLRVGRLLAERLGGEPEVLDEYRELARVLQELQQTAMRARMVSVATVSAPLRRAVRDLARGGGKFIRWEVAGEDTELDRHVLERLREPLVALIRNAIAHGIELPHERIAAGKDPEGVIRLHAMQLGGDVILSVADDGRGIDARSVAAAAGRSGLSEDDALSAIFEPGVSTAESVTGVSGRGVGLDAVRSAVEALRGRVEVRSTPGAGTEFRIRVPMTLALLRCLLLRCGERAFAMPMHAAVGLVAPNGDGIVSAEGRPAVWFAGDAVPLSDLARVLEVDAPPARGPAVVVSTPAGRHAFRVDAVTGRRDVVVKDLGRLVGRLDRVAGGSVEPDGSVMLVLDPTGVLEAAAGTAPAPRPALEAIEGEPPQLLRGRVLVVDDALTIRELQRSILERAGYAVLTAVNGRDALARLEEAAVDLVVTDVEMPELDGVALTEAIRGDERHAGLPVLILTSRASEEDRRRGLGAGADAYLVKSTFDEHALLTAVARLLETGGDGGEEAG